MPSLITGESLNRNYTVSRSCIISNTILRSTAQSSISTLPGTTRASFATRLRKRLFHKSTRRRAVRVSLILLNLVLLVVVLSVVLLNPAHSSTNAQPIRGSIGDQTATGPVDQLASVNIAVTAARMANMPETAAVTNQADSESIIVSLASANNTVVSKPQTVATSFMSNKDIHSYDVQNGDTVASIAAKFGVNSDSILWSNGLTGNNLTVGQKLAIPPMNGIVYTVRPGDTSSSLATKFHANEDKIIAYNDAEISGLHVGEQIIIPNGSIVVTPVYASYASSGFAWGSGAIYGFNGYDWGNCTWYVATQIPVPANWGNASTWAAGARAAGWHVSSVPSTGAIAQTPYAAGGLGHVAIVDGVSPDGTQVLIRDMNGIAGFARVGTAWEPISTYPNYITR